MKRLTTNAKTRALFFLSVFLIAWSALTVWLNIEHQKELSIISKSHELSLRVTHTSDVIFASHVTEYPQVHRIAIETYQTQLRDLQVMKDELISLWPNSGSSLVKAIDEAELAFKDLKSNSQSYSIHDKFSRANVYFKNMSFHEFSQSKRDLLHQNLPMFLILALAIVLIVRYVEKAEFGWSFSRLFFVRN